MNFVSSADGAAEIEGRSGTLGGPGDRQVFRVLRWLADVVLVGAGTARAEDYGPAVVPAERREIRVAAGLAPVPPVAVVSGSLEFDPTARLFGGEVRPLLLTRASAPPERVAALRAVAEVVTCGEDRVEPALVLAELAARGLGRVLCEGGPMLHAQLAGAGLLDELCLTVEPVLAGPGHLGIVAGAPWLAACPLELAHVLEEDGSLFLRYRVPREP
ncbi:pyrimidine reductase family protein [Frankia sp. CNm7]|uniref:Pyrimidine reductase family protein n=2 Tax=Frankia nepalensis TaxID=1836974 RepID=A0A937RD51_9ACTN|nr:pyrimidine reductase family protein [Frankia nepalensis]MBL7513809.1 pyrimidine reductase family protein [Frankia nepalensis]MBL7518971.1 pyrimidine reductase family protein [Frankia nepalensis]MBL7629931.1 pyrimidine reductase family protein [Frankia nepalensis]